jgi:hypothetical protein
MSKHIIQTVWRAKELLEQAQIDAPSELVEAEKETQKQNPDYTKIIHLLAILRENNIREMRNMAIVGFAATNQRTEYVIPTQ